MAPPLSSQPSPNTGAAPLNKVQKLAALLIILGPESTAKIFDNLGELEVEAISTEMTRMPAIEADLRDEILREFSEVARREATLASSLRDRNLGETGQKEQDEALV